jgi:uncharacterized protein YidB (DUF937 family)
MGLFDSITNMVSGALGESANGGTPGAADIMGMLQQHGFSPDMLVNQLQSSGLGEHVESWMGNGQNLPVSPEQIQAALGSPAVEAMAAKFGIDPSQVSALIGQHLPAIVNQSTQAQDPNA